MSMFKPTASLTSGLLARKGAAAPAGFTASLPSGSAIMELVPPNRPANERPVAERIAPRFGNETWPPAESRPQPPRPAARPLPLRAEAPARDTAPPKSDLWDSGMPQCKLGDSEGNCASHPDGVAAGAKVSLRLDAERHKKLRLAALHLGLSGQQLLLDALDTYLESAKGAVLGGDCACLRRPPGR